MSEVLASWSSFVSSGYECPAAGTAMHAAHVMLLALVEERDRLYARLEMVEAHDGEGNCISVEPYSIPDGIEARDATIRLLDDRVNALTARAEAAEAKLRESEAERVLLEALVAELKAEKQPTLSRFVTMLRKARAKTTERGVQ